MVKVLKLGKYANNDTLAVECYYKDSRSGFSHNAVAYFNGDNIKAKCNYINRTWEAYTYQSVLKCFCEKFAVAMFGVPSVSAMWNAKKWANARECANFLLAQV